MWFYVQTWDMAPFSDNGFDCCDLLQRNVIHHETIKAAAVIGTPSTFHAVVNRRRCVTTIQFGIPLLARWGADLGGKIGNLD